ncbi:MAG: holo-ACP synthase [Candidatus Puniceispirillaceae bacterium]
MILGIGHDMCDQRRIASLLERFGTRFTSRILSSGEQAELGARKNKPAYIAGRFAVKEAVYKALSATDQSQMRWQHASTTSRSAGAPLLELSGACLAGAEALLPAGHYLQAFVSITDEPPYSSAFVVLDAVANNK